MNKREGNSIALTLLGDVQQAYVGYVLVERWAQSAGRRTG